MARRDLTKFPARWFRGTPRPNAGAIRKADRATALPECDFVYFATPACGSWTITAEFVDSAKAIIAHAYNNVGFRMPLDRSDQGSSIR